MADDVILETRGLTKEFRGFLAVRDVSLRVRRGTIHALIGPNGAGKTTCFNLLTHFLVPTRGRITFNRRDITGRRPAEIARLGLVRSFQISAVFPHLTALENVRIALQRRRGRSFDFWRSERVLGAFRERALDGPSSCWPRWASTASPRPSRASCRTGGSGRSRSPPRWRSSPR